MKIATYAAVEAERFKPLGVCRTCDSKSDVVSYRATQKQPDFQLSSDVVTVKAVDLLFLIAINSRHETFSGSRRCKPDPIRLGQIQNRAVGTAGTP